MCELAMREFFFLILQFFFKVRKLLLSPQNDAACQEVICVPNGTQGTPQADSTDYFLFGVDTTQCLVVIRKVGQRGGKISPTLAASQHGQRCLSSSLAGEEQAPTYYYS